MSQPYGQGPPAYYPPPQQGGYPQQGYYPAGGQQGNYGPPPAGYYGQPQPQVVYVRDPKQNRSSGMSKSDCCLLALCAACFGCCIGDCLD